MTQAVKFSGTFTINTRYLSKSDLDTIDTLARQGNASLNETYGGTKTVAFSQGKHAEDDALANALNSIYKGLSGIKRSALYHFTQNQVKAAPKSDAMNKALLPPGVEITGPVSAEYAEILTPEALQFVKDLTTSYGPRLKTLLQDRADRQARLNAGEKLHFLPETKAIREGNWKIAPEPKELQDRRVEITGPVERKMIINALNSGASVFMADFEDSNAPTWDNVIQGQINLRDAVNGTISYTGPNGKPYQLNPKHAVLMVRPRGLHMLDQHVLINGKPVPAPLLDFGLYFFHNAKTLLDKGTAPYFYLPKMESHNEARLWDDIITDSEKKLGIPHGTTKATVLIETLPAAFEMDEILHELRDHSAGLNCGRWDYIFSCIKKMQNDPNLVFADRGQVTMESPFMKAYSELLIKTCHRRGAHAMGGMAAQIPIKNDPVANEAALDKVRRDKEREVSMGHDGTWVAHPGLVSIAKEIFDRDMPGPNQLDAPGVDKDITEADLLNFAPSAPITENGLRSNIRIAILYLGAWLSGNGCVPINNLMEDAATAEISRSQVWQWIHSPKGILENGQKVTVEMVKRMIQEELGEIKQSAKPEDIVNYAKAASLFEEMATKETFTDFLTQPAYEALNPK